MLAHTIQPLINLGLDDRVRALCRLYNEEADNPFTVASTDDKERRIQFLKSHIWDMERSLCEETAAWKYRLYELRGAVFMPDSKMAEDIYSFAVKTKLEMMEEATGIDFSGIYREFVSAA